MILAGIDGCRAGWIAALDDGAAIAVRVVTRLADLFDSPAPPDLVAVDMPIGLPDVVGPGGRSAERAVRPLLGARQSSVFSVPSRTAVMAADYRAACAAALATSDPPRKVSRQCFGLFQRIREIDELLAARPALGERVFESHPEVAFATLNGRPLAEPKKVKGVVHAPGMAERRAILTAAGLPAALLAGPAPPGAGLDDLLDAAACLAVARRIAAGRARPHPAEDIRDGRGLRISIWA